MASLEGLNALMTLLQGTAYEPWVKLSLFLLLLTFCWSAMAWLVMRRSSQALGRQLFTLLKRASGKLDSALQYPPAYPRRPDRVGLYSEFVGWVSGSIAVILFVGVISRALFVGVQRGLPWDREGVIWLIWIVFLVLTRLLLALALRAWYRIKTGD
jgi:hypothetical protein